MNDPVAQAVGEAIAYAHAAPITPGFDYREPGRPSPHTTYAKGCRIFAPIVIGKGAPERLRLPPKGIEECRKLEEISLCLGGQHG
jgi:hypothetical protein